MSARAHSARHLSIAKTQTRALNKCAKGGRSVPSGAQTSWLIHRNILPHKNGWESKCFFSLSHIHMCVCVCLARSRLKLAVLALGRTRGRGGVTGCWQIRLLSAMQAPVKQATLMSQKNNWRLPPAICCPHSLSIRVASIVSASIRVWRPVENTFLSTLPIYPFPSQPLSPVH